MVKVCARPACGAEATTRFFFDATNRLVILDARVAEWGGSGVLCDDHADRLTPPRGWVIDDRRVLAPRLFPVGRFETVDRPLVRNAPATAVAETAPAGSVDAPAPPAGLAPEAADLGVAARPARTRRFPSPAAHPSTPLPLDGGPSYALPDEYVARETAVKTAVEQTRSDTAPERLTDTADPGTPLLSRAFDASRSKVRQTSTLDMLIPRTN